VVIPWYGCDVDETAGVEVMAKAMRRKFSAEYKLEVLREPTPAPARGGGGVASAGGLYTSHLSTWRKQRRQGELGGLAPKKRVLCPRRRTR